MSTIYPDDKIRDKGVFGFARSMRNYRRVPYLIGQFNGIEGFSNGTNLVQLDQNRIAHVFIDGTLQPMRIGDEQIVAYELNMGFVPIRKKGKLPPETISQDYSLEYGTATVEISETGIKKGEKCLIVDDLIATGGTIYAATKLVESLGGEIVECAFIVDLPDLNGKEKIKQYPIFTLTEFEGE